MKKIQNKSLAKLLALTTLFVLVFFSFPMRIQAANLGDVIETQSNFMSGVVQAPVSAFEEAGGAARDAARAVWGALTSGGNNEDIVSFMGFQGGLTAPTGENLDAALTQSRTAREFIVKAVNFALSFLGVIAMAIIIYGGFLYVTAAGNDEQSGKGKKSIQYAAIGILIIIASFAIVNTLLTFGGGTGTGTGAGSAGGVRGSGQEGTNLTQQSLYNIAALSIGSALNDFLTGYKNLIAIDTITKRIKALPAPENESENRNYLNQITGTLNEIKTNTNSLSKLYAATRKLLDGWVAETSAKDLSSDTYKNGALKRLFDPALTALTTASHEDFDNIINQIIGENGTGGKLGTVKQILGEITDASANSIIKRGYVTENDIKRAFAGIDENLTVNEVMINAFRAVSLARGLPDSLNSQLVINVIKALDQLNIVVKNIEFVVVKIKASSVEGNSPFVVELNGLDSRDPTGNTITDDKYVWDPVGATFGSGDVTATTQAGQNAFGAFKKAMNAVECNPSSKRGATIVCTYNQPGTYMVSLKIMSKDPARVATGQAFLPITVLPSVARIALKATVAGNTEYLQKYEQDAEGKWILAIDKRELQITSQEAAAPGITFDGQESRAGGGATIKSYEWNFNDGTGLETTPSVQHVYKQKGKLPIKLEVTDSINRKDRKIVNILINSIAARTQVSTVVGEPEQLIEFDGSLSRSDKGSITSYAWRIDEETPENPDTEITNAKEKVEITSSKTSPVLRVKFKKAGRYKVTLTVNDGSQTASHTDTIFIKSRKPRANFTIMSCPENCPDATVPNVVEVDAGSTFDPDRNPLIYEWKIFSETGNELERGSSYFVLSENSAMRGPTATKLRFQFKKTGKYRIQLNVEDDLPPELKQVDVKEKTVEITSIVEARWNETINPVKKLQNGQAEFTINGTLKNANRVEIDFGDGETNEQSVELTNGAGRFEFTHSYTTAGSFNVQLKAKSDEGNGENTITKRFYVSSGDGPLAVIEASMNGDEILLPPATRENPNPALEIIRNKIIKFSARRSVDTNGAYGINLRYSWNFGDNRQSTGPDVEHSYENISPAGTPFIVTLTISEITNPSLTAQAKFYVHVISKKPEVNTLSMEKITSGSTTPVDVKLTAEGATDPDGRITNYQFWYYNPIDRERKLSVIDTQSETATLKVETAGEEGEEHEYFFCVSVTDNENTASTCDELFMQEELPKIKVTNGANKAPAAQFSADRTTAKIGETITFTSSSVDTDGRITSYIWDFDGDGFQNDNPTALSTVTHQYDRKSPQGGYRVKLKAIDDKNAAGYSREIPIHIESNAAAPTANFSYQVQMNPAQRVKFFDASTADANRGAGITKWIWDFDTSAEYGCENLPKPVYCNGDKTDDEDSHDQNPIFDFPQAGMHQVKLVVEDSDGNKSDPKTTLVNVIAGATGGAGAPPPGSNILKAELITDPTQTFEPVPCDTPGATEDCKKKVLHIPANSNGQNINFIWRNSTGDIVQYKIDNNTLCDSDGNGDRAGDTDFLYPNSSDPDAGTCLNPSTGATINSCQTIHYSRTARTDINKLGHFNTMLTVIDRSGNTDTDEVEIIFDGAIDENAIRANRCDGTPQSSFTASFFKDLGIQNTILLSLVSGVVVILMMFSFASFLIKGKRRNL